MITCGLFFAPNVLKVKKFDVRPNSEILYHTHISITVICRGGEMGIYCSCSAFVSQGISLICFGLFIIINWLTWNNNVWRHNEALKDPSTNHEVMIALTERPEEAIMRTKKIA